MNTHIEAHESEKITFGFWVYLMSDCVLFAGLFATYAVLHTAGGGPGAKELFSLPFVLTESMILLTSSFTCGIMLLSAHHHKKHFVVGWLVVTLLLGLAFVSMELSEFSQLIREGHGPSTSAFLSSFFTLVGTHGLHVTLGSLWILVLLAHVAIKGLTPGTLRKLACFGLFWHFLDLIWIFIFTFVYLFGFLSL